MDILLTAGLPWPTILYTLLIDEIMIITGLVGALVTSSYKVQDYANCLGEMLLIKFSGDTTSSDASLSFGLRGLSSGPAASTRLRLGPMSQKPTSSSALGPPSSGSSIRLLGDFLKVAMSSRPTLKLRSTVSWTS